MTISVTSTAFEAGKPIPKKYTGEGEDVSPPLAWSNVPQATKELALICDDPDAPLGTWVHWVLYKIPAETTSLPEGLPREKILTAPAAVQGVNSFSKDNLGYRGPMPPSGRHASLPLQSLCARSSSDFVAGRRQEGPLGRNPRSRAGPRRISGNVQEVARRDPEIRNPNVEIRNKFKRQKSETCPTSAGIAVRIPTTFASLERTRCRHCKRRPPSSPGS